MPLGCVHHLACGMTVTSPRDVLFGLENHGASWRGRTEPCGCKTNAAGGGLCGLSLLLLVSDFKSRGP